MSYIFILSYNNIEYTIRIVYGLSNYSVPQQIQVLNKNCDYIIWESEFKILNLASFPDSFIHISTQTHLFTVAIWEGVVGVIPNVHSKICRLSYPHGLDGVM